MANSDPFKRLLPLSLEVRSKKTSDPRLTVERAGYPEHNRKDMKFWKSSDDGSTVKAPSYSEWKFCEGFDLTALEFYIVRRRLMTLLYRNNLYTQKRRKDNRVELQTEFEYAEIEAKISKHSLLQGYQVHAFWKTKMIAEFVVRTAELMRQKRCFDMDGNGEKIQGEFYIKPNHTDMSPSWTWGKAVKALKYDKLDHTPPDRMAIIIRAIGSKEDHGETIRIRDLFPAGYSNKKGSFDDVQFDMLKQEVEVYFPKVKGEWKKYGVVYMNPYWGNELLLIEDDHSLRVAIKTLRVRGQRSITFYFLELPQAELPSGDGTVDADMDDESDVSSEASWKTEGYYSDGGIERKVRKVMRDAKRAEHEESSGKESSSEESSSEESEESG